MQPSQNDKSILNDSVSYCRTFLPRQGPLEYFVHHNPLHSFESTCFDKAVLKAAGLYGAEPYMTEASFIALYRSGRITDDDLQRCMNVNGKYKLDDLVVNGKKVSIKNFVAKFMSNSTRLKTAHTIKWAVKKDSGENKRLFVRFLMLLKKRGCNNEQLGHGNIVENYRRGLIKQEGKDIDDIINPFLISYLACYFDRGVAYWVMKNREKGLFACFLENYKKAGLFPKQWRCMLKKKASIIADNCCSPADVITTSLKELGISPVDWKDYLFGLAYRLKGWSGLILALEKNPDQNHSLKITPNFMEFLAIRVLVERCVAGPTSHGHEMTGFTTLTQENHHLYKTAKNLFNCWLKLGLSMQDFLKTSEETRGLIFKISTDYDEFKRRSVWQEAYENNFRMKLLSAVSINHKRIEHQRSGEPVLKASPDFQVLCCIDDREESFRRHMEEIAPDCETFGVAGHFGLDMKFKGVYEDRFRALCPDSVEPDYLVTEKNIRDKKSVRVKRKILGEIQKNSYTGTRTIMRSCLYSLLAGYPSVVPLMLKIYSPRLETKIHHLFEHKIMGATQTRIDYETLEDNDSSGYNAAEMAERVAGILLTSGLTGNFSRFVFIFGHGSESSNNPHEAAHDCGACGGGRGVVHGRIFAKIANRRDVRKLLVKMGINIPDKTVFIGGYHNTCNSELFFFDDTGLLDDTGYMEAKGQIKKAAMRNAHERSRKFLNVRASVDGKRAYRHVEGRSNSISQPRPEYGHATNAICVVGRRKLTKNLFMDRRAFLVSYDHTKDKNGKLLGALLASVGPVCAGINLEYYFSFVDNTVYGSSTKLPHNITGLMGVMNGHKSDLQLGLPWQMVEIHEPMRLQMLIEAPLESVRSVIKGGGAIGKLVNNYWIGLSVIDPATGKIFFFKDNTFEPVDVSGNGCITYSNSHDIYSGTRGHLDFALVRA